MILKFGKYKGKDLTQVPTEYLDWLATKGVNVNDPKYGLSNQQLVDACYEVMNSRADVGSYGPKHPKAEIPTIQLQKPGKEALIRSIQGLIDNLYKHAAEMQKLLDEHRPDGSIVTTKSDHLPF